MSEKPEKSGLLQTLVSFSRRYGADPSLVIAGGGNTSMKENGILYVKASGAALADIDADGFAALDIGALLKILNKAYPEGDAAREAAFLADVCSALVPGIEPRRPSVEALLHALFPHRYVLHLHPTLINGLTCAVDGEKWAARLFPDTLWAPECRPGHTLALLLAEKLRPETDTVLLQNHGVFIAADTEKEIDDILRRMLRTLETAVRNAPQQLPESAVRKVPELLTEQLTEQPPEQPPQQPPEPLPEIALDRPFTPDQIVYCGLGPALPESAAALSLYEDARNIARYAACFGGPRPMSADLVSFIVNWEAENYRKSKS